MSIIILPAVLVLPMLIITVTCWDKEEFCEKANPNCSDPIVVKTCPERCGVCAKGNENLYLFDNMSWSQNRFQHLYIYKYAKILFLECSEEKKQQCQESIHSNHCEKIGGTEVCMCGIGKECHPNNGPGICVDENGFSVPHEEDNPLTCYSGM